MLEGHEWGTPADVGLRYGYASVFEGYRLLQLLPRSYALTDEILVAKMLRV